MYNSLYWDPHTSGIDALFQTDWGHMNNYVNPPSKVLNIVKEQKAVATLIAPKWIGQPCYQHLIELLVRSTNKVAGVTQDYNRTGPSSGTFQKQTLGSMRLIGQGYGVAGGPDGPPDRL